MTRFPLSDAALAAFPPPFDSERLARGLDRWREEADRLAEDAPDLAGFMRAAAADGAPARRALEACFGNSPYLSTCLFRDPAVLRRVVEDGPDAALDHAFATVRDAVGSDLDTNRVMRALRIAKRQVALIVALADMSKAWPLGSVTGALTDFADLALSLSTGHLLRVGAAEGNLELAHSDDPNRDSGYVVLGMGKHGAGELNYSSDIDLIVLYDPEICRYVGKRTPGEFFIRMTKTLVRMMDERTGDGYVFRTDLRLRPDPGSTAVAISTDAAETYYESFGQNWERAAMIKVRPVAGDIARGQAFVSHLRPFVWRKSLDFYAIQDIHSIKRQINAQRACGVVAVAGHNIKLGRGGIREIEFYAQTQQLIWGGREPSARRSRTLDALQALTDLGHVRQDACDVLSESYRFLRALEHRLQMIDDAQTQTLPKEPEKLLALATFMGFPSVEAFSTALRGVLCTVEEHYAALFEDSPSLSQDGGNLVFTGNEDDPDTLRTLTEIGYTNPQSVAGTVRGWHHGRYRATRSTRAKELLTELVPTLLRALGRTAQPDHAFFRFDEFLSRLPAGVQLFSLFHVNPGLLDLVAEIMGDAPRLAEVLSRRPNMLDAVLTPGFFNEPPGAAELDAEVGALLDQSRDFEETLDLLRLWANGRKFQVGVQTLRKLLDARQAGEALTTIADVVLGRLLPAVEEEFARAHGHIAGGSMVVIAMGKAGGREMTATSDLDLITVYDAPAESEFSEGGKRPLSRTDYYIRLTQRLVNAITVMTNEGRLYEVDLRLRPSGSKGPLATSLESFRRYNAEAAWTWEHMALTRARVVCGPEPLTQAAGAVIRDALAKPRDPDKLLVDVADMRGLMARERKAVNAFDVKLARGGLVDVEFATQYLILRHGADHPEVCVPNVAEALDRLRAAGVLDPQDADVLIEGQGLWLAIQGVLRHSIEGAFKPEEAPPGLKDKLARTANEPSFDTLCARMDDTYAKVHAVFKRLIEDPAEEARRRLGATAPQENDR
ncbi:bifunctional [glutamine synthetase] adenylyltransferase/[glutamine synthetase]-adenylyl-L-tyrosine phosphorylase [Novispirillum sp. DQ9]|uniref:bifunctional [glutamine synthetase] adenylyltransferase/[glutamine synthetase]-adenylyl-L-tyrosine phosphorylase n=1 Tax=Novispirillum sp. DQ9 TaxID=3398612 RepID=UPI003C7A299D